MKMLQICFLSLMMCVTSSYAQTTQTFNPQQKQEIEQIISDYIINNPEILVKATQVLQKRQQQAMMGKARKAISKHYKEVFNSPTSPVVGAKNAKATVVEYFDYQCIYCKRMEPVLEQLLEKDKEVRVVYKVFPIFGGASSFAARAVLAANKQGKFVQLHRSLLEQRGKLSESKILRLAKKAGIDVDRLKKDMKDKSIDEELKANRRLMEKDLAVQGTPAFILGPNPASETAKTYLVPGFVSLSMLQSLINEVKA